MHAKFLKIFKNSSHVHLRKVCTVAWWLCGIVIGTTSSVAINNIAGWCGKV